MSRRIAATVVGAPILLVHMTADLLSDLLRRMVLPTVLIVAVITPVVTAEFNTGFGMLRIAVTVLIGWAIAEGVRGAASYAPVRLDAKRRLI